MIERTQAFKTSDGANHSSLEEAKIHELAIVITPAGEDLESIVGTTSKKIAEDIVRMFSDRVVDILTTSATSKPRARKVNGGKKTRAAKPASAPAQ